jgi:putative ABC transport system substrate-binding protein
VYGAKVPHIDYLSQGSEADRGVFLGAFKAGLREFGWIDGKNVVIDVHWAPAYEFPQLAASLVKRNPAAIVGTCIPSTRAAKNATTTIPVVMSVNGDPVESGLVASLARPGANVTGTSTLFEELIPKWFEIISEIIPNIRTVAVMANPDSVGDEYWWAQAQRAAERIRLDVVRTEAHTPAGLGPGIWEHEEGACRRVYLDGRCIFSERDATHRDASERNISSLEYTAFASTWRQVALSATV